MPITGANVEILNTNISNISSSNLSGNYSTGTAVASSYDVVFSKPGYLSDTLNVILNNGVLSTLDAALVPLTPISLNGTVVDSNGITVPNSQILVYNDDFTFSLVADSNGFFNINTIYEGSYNISVGSWGYITYCSTEYIDSSSSLLISLEHGYYDDFTFDFGWSVTGAINQSEDGIWERGFPQGTIDNQGQYYNPPLDISNDCMSFAYVTGLQSGSQIGSYDVDNANTILTSPIFELNPNLDHTLSLYSWFQNGFPWGGGANDSLKIMITNGSTTVPLEILTSSSPNLGQWNQKSFVLNPWILRKV